VNEEKRDNVYCLWHFEKSTYAGAAWRYCSGTATLTKMIVGFFKRISDWIVHGSSTILRNHQKIAMLM
jgi:hypothetical protein